MAPSAPAVSTLTVAGSLACVAVILRYGLDAVLRFIAGVIAILGRVTPGQVTRAGDHVQAKYPASAYRGLRADVPDWLIGVPYAR